MPLDQGVGDSLRLPTWEGSSGHVAQGLAERAADHGLGSDARSRLTLARRLVELLPTSPAVAVWMDLRSPAAGPNAMPPQRDGSRVVELPWLVLRAGPHEARVVRVATVKRGLAFREGQVGPAVAAQLDELCLQGPEGVARCPLRAPVLEALPRPDPLAPAAGPLPATAPGEPGGSPQLALAQAAVTALLLLVLALGMERAMAGPSRGEPSADRVWRGLGALEPAARRAALKEAESFPPLERARALRQAAERDEDAEVRGLALELLAGHGELGATCLALVHRSAAPPLSTRLQALRLLRDLGDPRARWLAESGLRAGSAQGRLRAAWAETMVETGVETLALHQLLLDADPLVRAVAGRALLVRLGPVAVPSVVKVMTRDGQPRQQTDGERAQVELCWALRPALTARERKELRAHPALCARARAALDP